MTGRVEGRLAFITGAAGGKQRSNPDRISHEGTDIIAVDLAARSARPDMKEKDRTRERLVERFQTVNALPIPWVEPVDTSKTVLWLASDESRYVTGVTVPVDAGSLPR